MKKNLSAAVFGLLLAPAAFAGEFDGFNLGISLNAIGAETALSASGGSVTMGETSVNGTVFAQYGIMAANNTLMSFGASYDIGDTASGQVSSSGLTYKFKGTNHYSIYFEPGVLLTKSTMLYGRASYHGFDGKVEGVAGSRTFDGAGLAFGVRTKLNSDFALQAEVEGVSYASESQSGATYKPKTAGGKVAVIYQFK